VTNALKYAYTEGQGVISISIRQTDHGHVRLEVSDSGVGLPDVRHGGLEKSLDEGD
jgi:two-component sensor histidine kinase